MKTIAAKKLHPIRMAVRKKPTLVIKDGAVYEYVGIGWVNIRPATAKDKKKYPQVK